jgi:DNA-binding CsgD family transcriptional regulator
LSDEQFSEAVRMKAEGWSYRKIGDALGFTYSQIREQLVPRRMGKRLGSSELPRGAVGRPRLLTDEQLEKAIRMREGGATSREIGAALGFSREQIKNRLTPKTARRQSVQGLRAQADGHLLRSFGVTPERYEALSARQNDACAICGKTEADGSGRRLAIDHDHACCPGRRTCGKCIRGLLCTACNLHVDKPWFRAERGPIVDDYLEGRLIPIWQAA